MKAKMFIWILTFALVVTAHVSGQGFILPNNNMYAPRLTDHRVDADINNQVAEVHIRQVFKNNSSITVEGVYYFPIPKEASVSEFAMWVDGKKLEGELLGKDEARKIYEEIVRRNIDPALLEYADYRFFRINIFPIPPGKEREIELRYAQFLNMKDGLVRLLYPLHGESTLGQTGVRVDPRPWPPRTWPRDQQREEDGSRGRQSDSGCRQNFLVDIESDTPIRNIYSPSHDVEISRRSDHRMRISYEGTRRTDEGDFVLYYSVSPDDLGLSLICHKPGTKQGYFLLLISPKTDWAENEILKKDIVFVLDTSGSMSGEKIEQAKDALQYCLNQLRPEDRFALITFSSDIRKFNERLMRVSDARSDALDFIRDIRAKGGTNIDEALTVALSYKAEQGRPLNTVFLTDGLPTVGNTDIKSILNDVRKRTENVRVFTFGVGYDVNTYLLDRIAGESRAVSDYITPEENIEEKVSLFFDKINRPVLADLELDFDRVATSDIYPKDLPDLFLGEQLMVVGRYKSSGRTKVTLKGASQAKILDFNYGCEFSKDKNNDFLPRLWASRKIAYLVDEIRTNGENSELRKEIEELSKEYGIMSPFTSYLVQEDEGHDLAGRQPLSPAAASRGAVSFLKKGEAAAGRYDINGVATGQGAVEMSRDLRRMKEAKQLEGISAENARYIAGKTFYYREGIWVDASYSNEKTIQIKRGAGACAYTNLLLSFPELGKYMSLGDHIILGFNGHFIEIGKEGETDLSEAELNRMLQ